MLQNFSIQLFIALTFLNVCSSKWPGISTCKKRGVVALTFDDGPSPNGGTESVLDVLREEDVRATFFVTGQGFDKTFLDEDVEKQDLLRQIFDEGHQIGSHSWSHYNFTQKTIPEIRQDVQKLAIAVRNTIGVNMTVFRAPYGESSIQVAKLFWNEFGYKLIRWSIDTMDWFNRENTETSLKNYKYAISSLSQFKKSFISLHHCPAIKSGELARKTIKFMKSKGFKFVTVAECIGTNEFNYLY